MASGGRHAAMYLYLVLLLSPALRSTAAQSDVALDFATLPPSARRVQRPQHWESITGPGSSANVPIPVSADSEAPAHESDALGNGNLFSGAARGVIGACSNWVRAHKAPGQQQGSAYSKLAGGAAN